MRQDPLLAGIYRFVQLVVIARGLWSIAVHHEYNKLVSPTGSANVYAEMGASNYFHHKPGTYSSYCNKTGIGASAVCFRGHDISNNSCRDFLFGELLEKEMNGLSVDIPRPAKHA